MSQFRKLYERYLNLRGLDSINDADDLMEAVESLNDYGNLDEFFNDNPGAAEAVVEYVMENGHKAIGWKEKLEEAIAGIEEIQKESEEEEDGG